jgi:hypothetical protein
MLFYRLIQFHSLVPSPFNRLIESARVIDNQICYDIKDANQLYELWYLYFLNISAVTNDF